jgi:hypothetical protein
LPDHPKPDALYRYYEEMYAPIHSCSIDGEKYRYFDLKNETSIEMNDVIAKIIHHAAQTWGIVIPDRATVSLPEAKELYLDAYTEMWREYFNNPQ